MKHLKSFENYNLTEKNKKNSKAPTKVETTMMGKKEAIKIVDDFFNKLAKEIDKKYFPDVKYYRDDEDDTAVHYAIELFNNGVTSYDKLISKLSKHCKDTKENIHKIVKKYIEDFGDYKFE